MPNPYTLVFGQPPVEIIERAPQAERIVSEFCQENPSNYINLVTGIRGSGKTVFITEIADRLAQMPEWIVINLNPQRDLLTSFAAKLSSKQGLGRIFREANINLEFFGIGVGIENSSPVVDIEEALIRMLRSLQQKGRRVLITIDEVTNSKEMRIFASTFQILLRERLPVFLLMTGLYKNVNNLRNADGMTFLERAPRTVLGPLSMEPIAQNYLTTLQVGQTEANRLAAATKGYSFGFQTIGYYAFEHPGNLAVILSEAREYLFEFAYEKIWSELSRKDREVVIAIACTSTGRVAEIREKLQYTTNQFNPYQDRLKKAGILISTENGLVEFTLPFFDDFARHKDSSCFE